MRLGSIALILISMTAAALAQNDAAAGPYFWAVSALRNGGSLNVRTEPSTSAPVALQISEGTILRNLGCEGTGPQRWCRVESSDGITISGWVSGAYLRESGPPSEGRRRYSLLAQSNSHPNLFRSHGR